MAKQIDARCTACGATFLRDDATTEFDNKLACPACGCGVVQGIPTQHNALIQQENARCGACGATFSRSESVTETKGRLACPVCGENDVRTIDESQ